MTSDSTSDIMGPRKAAIPGAHVEDGDLAVPIECHDRVARGTGEICATTA